MTLEQVLCAADPLSSTILEDRVQNLLDPFCRTSLTMIPDLMALGAEGNPNVRPYITWPGGASASKKIISFVRQAPDFAECKHHSLLAAAYWVAKLLSRRQLQQPDVRFENSISVYHKRLYQAPSRLGYLPKFSWAELPPSSFRLA